MKKLIFVLLTALILSSCTKRDYDCFIWYKIEYPDTTMVKMYQWDGNSQAHYEVSKVNDATVLSIAPAISWVTEKEIDMVNEEGTLEVLKFRMFRKDLGDMEIIPKKGGK